MPAYEAACRPAKEATSWSSAKRSRSARDAGLRSEPLDLPAHPFVDCPPACWSYYAALLEFEHEHSAILNGAERLTIDAYSAQHPGGSISDRALCIHLLGLYLAFERKAAPKDISALWARVAESVTTWPHLERPMYLGALNVSDFEDIDSLEAFFELAVRWSSAVWQAWARGHKAIARLAAGGGLVT